MAIYKGREVVIDQFISNESPIVKVSYVGSPDGDTEWVKLDQLALTKEEKKMIDDQNPEGSSYAHLIDKNTIMPTVEEAKKSDAKEAKSQAR